MSFLNSVSFMLVVSFVVKPSYSATKVGMKLGDFQRGLLQAEENSTDYFASTSADLHWICMDDCNINCDANCDGDCDSSTCNSGCDDLCDSGCTSCCDSSGYNCDCSCNYDCDSGCDESCVGKSCDEDCDEGCDTGCNSGCAWRDTSSLTGGWVQIWDNDGDNYQTEWDFSERDGNNKRFKLNWNVAGLVLLSIITCWM